MGVKLEEGISEQRVEMKMGFKYIAEGENNVLSHEAVHKFSSHTLKEMWYLGAANIILQYKKIFPCQSYETKKNFS